MYLCICLFEGRRKLSDGRKSQSISGGDSDGRDAREKRTTTNVNFALKRTTFCEQAGSALLRSVYSLIIFLYSLFYIILYIDINRQRIHEIYTIAAAAADIKI